MNPRYFAIDNFIIIPADEENGFTPQVAAKTFSQHIEEMNNQIKLLDELNTFISKFYIGKRRKLDINIVACFSFFLCFFGAAILLGVLIDRKKSDRSFFIKMIYAYIGICLFSYPLYILAKASVFSLASRFGYFEVGLNELPNAEEGPLLHINLQEWILDLFQENSIELNGDVALTVAQPFLVQIMQEKTELRSVKMNELIGFCREHHLRMNDFDISFNYRAERLGIQYDLNQHSYFKEFVCPFSLGLPEEPVIALDGNIYDRKFIENFIDQNEGSVQSPTHPEITITKDGLITVLAVKNHIYEHLSILEHEKQEEMKVNPDSGHANLDQSLSLLQRSGQLVSSVYSYFGRSEEEETPLLDRSHDAGL